MILRCFLWTIKLLNYFLQARCFLWTNIELNCFLRASWVLSCFFKNKTKSNEIIWFILNKTFWSSNFYIRWNFLRNKKFSSSRMTSNILIELRQQWIKQKNENMMKILNSKLTSISWRRNQEKLIIMKYWFKFVT